MQLRSADVNYADTELALSNGYGATQNSQVKLSRLEDLPKSAPKAREEALVRSSALSTAVMEEATGGTQRQIMFLESRKCRIRNAAPTSYSGHSPRSGIGRQPLYKGT